MILGISLVAYLLRDHARSIMEGGGQRFTKYGQRDGKNYRATLGGKYVGFGSEIRIYRNGILGGSGFGCDAGFVASFVDDG